MKKFIPQVWTANIDLNGARFSDGDVYRNGGATVSRIVSETRRSLQYDSVFLVENRKTIFYLLRRDQNRAQIYT